MAVDFDIFPVYDPLTLDGDYMSDDWILSMSTFIQTLQEYLTQYGALTPKLTTSQRDQIQSPQEGQLIYNTNIISTPNRTGGLQVWQVKADVGAWRTITTTP
jgi:hypothetical protein